MAEMKDYEATEIAYKRGYEQGMKDAVKHGRWIWVRDRHNYAMGMKCSECGRRVKNCGENYCPNCGAKMDLEEEK